MQIIEFRLRDNSSPADAPPFDGLRVLDLYCGSGALALEALSRGAASATLVDASSEAIRVASANIRSLDVAHAARTVRGRLPHCLRRLPPDPFDLVFADPPYDFNRFDSILDVLVDRDLLAPDALVVYEHASGAAAPPHDSLQKEPLRTWGDTTMSLYIAPGHGQAASRPPSRIPSPA